MRLFFILMIALLVLNGCGKKPNTLEDVRGTVPMTYPQPEPIPGR